MTDTFFEYEGLLSGVNSNTMESAPSLDNNGNFYFTSYRTVDSDFQALYSGDFRRGGINHIETVDAGLARKVAGLINFDSEISANGQRLYYATGLFEGDEFQGMNYEGSTPAVHLQLPIGTLGKHLTGTFLRANKLATDPHKILVRN